MTRDRKYNYRREIEQIKQILRPPAFAPLPFLLLLSAPAHVTHATTRPLHEVGHQCASLNFDGVVRVRDFPEQQKVTIQLLIQLEYGRHVPAAVAVVGRGPDGDEYLLRKVVLIPLHYQLVSPTN